MKKITSLLFAIAIFSGTVIAAPITVKLAQQVAANYYRQNSNSQAASVALVHTETDNAGNALYYVFNINGTEGFVIVSADDALHPIIGYSNEGRAYAVPVKGTNMDFWMEKRKTELIANKSLDLKATSNIKDEWTSYANNETPQSIRNTRKAMGSSPFPSSTAYLVKSTWNQSSPYSSSSTVGPFIYNSLCPGHSVTGCVATTMSQIMRYWQYPAKGIGSSSYCDCTASGDQAQYGTLSANYGTTTYHWSNMPLNPTSITDVDTLMYDAGVSVDMNYDPSGSSAYVIGGSPCAQSSYVQYFGYSSAIEDGLNIFSDTVAWKDTLEKELNHSRPLEYAGQTTSQGGHTWVCDGYNSGNLFHMNWGWGGQDDGWYYIDDLNAGGYDFNSGFQAIVGIMPPGGTIPSNPTCDTSCNVPSSATITYYEVNKGNYYTGTYGDTIQQVAEYFKTAPPANYSIGSVNVEFAKASSTSPSRTVTVEILDNTGTGGSPGAVKGSQTVNVSNIIPWAPFLFTFDPPVTLSTPYYVAVNFTTLATNYKTDTLAIATDQIGQSKSTAWQYDVAAKYGLNGWYNDSIVWGSSLVFSQNISVEMCYSASPTAVNNVDISEGVKLYPNPTTGIITAEVSLDQTSDMNVEVYNTLGQMIQQAHWGNVSNTTRTIDISGQATGMYFVKFITAQSTNTKKVMLNR